MKTILSILIFLLVGLFLLALPWAKDAVTGPWVDPDTVGFNFVP